jgi:hypothetical protein
MSSADLEQTSTPRILAFLYKKRKSTRTQLIKATDTNTTTPTTLAKLKKLGLIQEKKKQHSPSQLKFH